MHTYEPWVEVPTETRLADYRWAGPPADGSLSPGSGVWWQVIAALGVPDDVLPGVAGTEQPATLGPGKRLDLTAKAKFSLAMVVTGWMSLIGSKGRLFDR